MIKKLYDGSSNIIEKPLYGYGKSCNDYGSGFYCTHSLEMARVFIFIENMKCGISNLEKLAAFVKLNYQK